jgi:hypothetical protein
MYSYNSLLGNRLVNVSPQHIIALNNKIILLGNRAINIPSQHYLRRGVFYAVCAAIV